MDCLKDLKSRDRDTNYNFFGWSLSQERVHIEDLVTKRATVMLALVAVTVTVAINSPEFRAIILGIGALFSYLIGETVVRAHNKLIVILKELYRIKNHPIAWTDRLTIGRGKNQYIGIYVPRLCTALLLVASLTFSSPWLAVAFKWMAVHLLPIP